MADGTFPGLVSKDNNQNAIANPIYVQLTDGSAIINVTGSALDVNIANTSIEVTANQLDIDDLVAGIDTGEDNVLIFSNTVKDGTGTNYVPLVDTDGHLQVDVLTAPTISYVDDSAFGVATDKVNASGYLADEVSPDSIDEGDIGLARMTLDRKQLFVLVDPSTDSQRLTINAGGEAEVSLQSHNIDNSNALPISKDNDPNSELNPIYVQEVTTGVSGSEVHDYDTDTVIASGTSNHDYTVANSTFLLKSIIVSASGNCKFEIQVGALASLVTVAVGFLTGREGDTKQINFEPAIEVPVTGTGTVRIIRTNRQNQSQDLYSTIIGNDV